MKRLTLARAFENVPEMSSSPRITENVLSVQVDTLVGTSVAYSIVLSPPSSPHLCVESGQNVSTSTCGAMANEMNEGADGWWWTNT